MHFFGFKKSEAQNFSHKSICFIVSSSPPMGPLLSFLLLLLPLSFTNGGKLPGVNFSQNHSIPSYRSSRALTRLDFGLLPKDSFVYVVNAFYDTRPLLFLRPPEVIVNAAASPSLRKVRVGCLVGRREKGGEGEMELVFSGPAGMTHGSKTGDRFNSALLSCPIPSSLHFSLFSSLSYDYFVTLLPSGVGGGGKFQEVWIALDLLPNHPYAPLSLSPPPPPPSSFSSDSPDSLPHLPRGIGVKEYMEVYSHPWGQDHNQDQEDEQEEQELDPETYLQQRRQQEEREEQQYSQHQQQRQSQQTSPFQQRLDIAHFQHPHHHHHQHQHQHHQSIAICTSPMITGISSYKQKVPLFIEYYKMLGANYFYFYDSDVNDPFTPRYLSLYESQQIAEVISFHNPSALPTNIFSHQSPFGWWSSSLPRGAFLQPTSLLSLNLTEAVKKRGGMGLERGAEKGGKESILKGLSVDAMKRVHYRGQTMALHDCLARTIGKFRWVFFIDIDEYITISWPKASPYLTPLPLSSSLFPSSHNTTSPPHLPPDFSHVSSAPLSSSLPSHLTYITEKGEQKYRFSLLSEVIHRSISHSHQNPSSLGKVYPTVETAVLFSNLFHCPNPVSPCKVDPSLTRVVDPSCSTLSASFSSKYECEQSCPQYFKLLPNMGQVSEGGSENFTIFERFQKHFSPLRWDSVTKGARTKFVCDPMQTFLLSVHFVLESMNLRHGVEQNECDRGSGKGLKGDNEGEGGERGFDTSELKKILKKGRMVGPQFALQVGKLRERRGTKEWGATIFEGWERGTEGEREGGREVLMMLGGGVEIKGRGCEGFLKGKGVLVDEGEAVMRHFHPMNHQENTYCTILDFDFLNTYGHHLFTAVERNQDLEKVDIWLKRLKDKKRG